jgi:uncharacterized protein (TIGR03663 family)
MMKDPDPAERTVPRFDVPWLAACTAITAVAAVFRFYDLALKPFHHDEGVNGFFLNTLVRDGIYRYDPSNYHGPTLYYIALAFVQFFGLETETVRASVAVFGVLTVVLAFFFRPWLGRIGSLFAGLCLALSPGMVFISRYFIHEIFFVFLGLGLALSVLLFLERRSAGIFAIGWMAMVLLVAFLPTAMYLASVLGGDDPSTIWIFRVAIFVVEAILVSSMIRMLIAWDNGRPIYLLLPSACASLMFATKETAFITLGTMLIAVGCIWIWQRIDRRSAVAEPESVNGRLTWANFRGALGSPANTALVAAAVVVVFLYLFVLFFSSFFTYGEGVQKAIDAYTIWTKTGSRDHTMNGQWAYLYWGMRVEGPILVLSGLGMVIAFARSRSRFGMFAALWAFGMFAAYTLIPYKTPWLALSFLVPMCLTAGYAIEELYNWGSTALRTAAAAAAAIAVVIMGVQAYDLNFVNYDNNDKPYVYAHTRRAFLRMIDRIEYYAEKSGRGRNVRVQIVSPDYWPMVWYMRQYPQAIFHGRLANADDAELIVTKKTDQDTEAIARYAAGYKIEGEFALRPGVDLVLLVRKDIADPETKELYRLKNP